MRQVNADELVHLIQSLLRRLSKAQLNALTHWRPEEALRGRLAAAQVIAASFARLEILSAAPEPPFFRYPGLEQSGPENGPTSPPPDPADGTPGTAEKPPQT